MSETEMDKRAFFFLLGFWAILGQIIFFRETLVIFFGNEITVGLFYAVWFAGIFAGASSGSGVSDRFRRPFSALMVLLPIIILITAGGAVMLRLDRGIFGIPVGELASFSTMAMILITAVFPLSLLVGFSFPLACRAAARNDLRESIRYTGFTVGTVYLYESFGSLCAGLLHTFYLVERLEVFPMIFYLGLISMLIFLLAISVGGERKTRKTLAFALTVCILILGSILLNLPRTLESWTEQARWKTLAKNMELVDSVDSRYQNITLTRQNDQYNIYLNGFYSESFPDPYGNALLAHFVMVEHPNPRNVLIIGSGHTGLLGQVLLHHPQQVDIVELDGKLLSLPMEYLPPAELNALSARGVHVVKADGRFYIKEQGSKPNHTAYDVVILNLPEPSSALLNRYYTVDFFRELTQVLSTDGVVAASLPFSENYLREEVLEYGKSIYSSLGSVFRHVIIAPGNRIFFFASNADGVVTTDSRILEARFESRKIESQYFSKYHYEMLLQPERVKFIADAFRKYSEVPENTDMNPITYYFGYMLWDRYSGGSLSPILRFVAGIKLYHLLTILLSVFLLRILLHRLRRERYWKFTSFAALFSIWTTGMAGMAVSIILMFSFQNAVGYLYGNIGALVALFMFGLAIGGWLQRRDVTKPRREDLMILYESIAVAFILFLALFLSHVQGLHGVSFSFIERLFYLLMFICGVYTGAEFPLTSSIYVGEIEKLGRGVGIIDAMDHGGALVGALITGVLLVPVVGIVMTLCFLAGMKAVGLFFWLYGRWVRV